jgi:hypothetical protein
VGGGEFLESTRPMGRVYNDGLVRYWLADSWKLTASETDDDAVIRVFQHAVTGHSLMVVRQARFLEDPEGEIIGEEAESDIEEVEQRTFLEEERSKSVELLSGFWMSSTKTLDQSEVTLTLDLTAFDPPSEQLIRFVLTMSEVDWGDIVGRQLWHEVRRSARRTECSRGQLQEDSSEEWLSVDPLGMILPMELGGLGYRFATIYEGETPGLGLSFRYTDGEAIRLDLYVYDLNLDYLEDGVSSAEVLEQFDAVQTGLDDLESYSEVELQRTETLTISGRGEDQSFLYALYHYHDASEPGEKLLVHSHIILTAYRGKFIKIRASYGEEWTQIGQAKVAAFLRELAEQMGR